MCTCSSPDPRGCSGPEPRLCWLGRAAQKLGCLPTKTTRTQTYYPIDVRAVDSNSYYNGYTKDKPDLPRPPSPQPDEPQPQMTLHYTPTYQHSSPQVPKSPKKTPIAQTVPLSTLQLPVHALPVHTPITAYVAQTACPTPVNPAVHITQTPCLVPLSAIPQSPHQNPFPDSILQDLGNVAPTQYVWNTPHGALAWTPTPASHLPLPNPFADSSPCPKRIVDLGDGNDRATGLGLIPGLGSPDSSDSSSDSSDTDYRSGITVNPALALNGGPPGATSIEWDVSDPAEMAVDVDDNAGFLASMREPATNPPTNTLCIDLCFVNQPGAQWNWEPIVINKRRSIRVVDVLHAVHNYLYTGLTHAEYDIIKSYGRRNAKIVAKSWSERVASQPDEESQSATYHGGLKRLDCLGSSRFFAGLWVEGSQLKLGLRA